MIILPLPIWLLYYLYQLASAFLRMIAAVVARYSPSSNQPTAVVCTQIPQLHKLPKKTPHQNDPYCARASCLLLVHLNAYRASLKLPALAWNDKLEASALFWGKVMAQHDTFEHEIAGEPKLEERIQMQGYRGALWAENLAMHWGNVHHSEHDYARLTHDGWVQSPGHEKNLRSPQATEIGIAVVIAGDTTYAIQNFGKPQQFGL